MNQERRMILQFLHRKANELKDQNDCDGYGESIIRDLIAEIEAGSHVGKDTKELN